MAKSHKVDDEDVFAEIARNPGTNQSQIARRLGTSTATISRCVERLEAAGRIHTGLGVSSEYRSQLFKSYIFINTHYQGEREQQEDEVPYQQALVHDIQEKIRLGGYAGSLFLESVEIVMGATFDIILIVSAKDIGPIGNFVTKFLRPHRDVEKTQTVTVWPSQQAIMRQTPESKDAGESDEDSRSPVDPSPPTS
ncbi:MAG: winged helix-turn-helix domain-containing protein [Isosphaeraceae bacterium]